MKEAEKVIAELEWFRSTLINGGKVPEYYEAQSGILTKAIKLLEQPERNKGEWIPEFNGKFTGGVYWFSCSKCKRIVPEVRNGGWNFCPSCGADMRGKQDE